MCKVNLNAVVLIEIGLLLHVVIFSTVSSGLINKTVKKPHFV